MNKSETIKIISILTLSPIISFSLCYIITNKIIDIFEIKVEMNAIKNREKMKIIKGEKQ